ncbi:MAG: hypothetical protein ABEI99_03965 [Halobaculum sp.]
MVKARQRLGLLILYGLSLAVILGPEVLGIGSLQKLLVQSLGERANIALRLAQVAVLYFAVLVAVVRFVHDSQQLAYEKDRLLFVLPPLSLLLVSISAALAVLTLLDVSPNESLIGSLGAMGTAFLLSFLATVAGGIGRVQETESPSSEQVARPLVQSRSKLLAPVRSRNRRDDGSSPGHNRSRVAKPDSEDPAEPKDP